MGEATIGGQVRDPIFVKVKNDHGNTYRHDPKNPGGSSSYSDLWDLVEISGFERRELKDCDLDSDETFIAMPWNGYVAAHFRRHHRCRLIHWNIERPGITVEPYVDQMWVSDKTQCLMARENNKNVQYLPLGGHPNYGGEPRYPKVWDMLPLAYAYGARAEKLLKIQEMGLSLAPATFAPAEKAHTLSHSRFGLMLHQTDHPIMTPLRAVLFASWRLPIIAEAHGDSYPYQFIPYDPELNSLTDCTQEQIAAMVAHNYKAVTKTHTFRGSILKAMESLP